MTGTEPGGKGTSEVAENRGRIRQAAEKKPKLAEKRGRLKDVAENLRRRLRLWRWLGK